MDLPVLEVVSALREKLSDHPVVILQAPPGAGKSTILPLKLLDEPWLKGRKMIMLEPRRLAAKSVAERMTFLHNENEKTGDTVGYRVRFDTKITARTRIEVVTEGILTRMIQSDNSLEGVGLLIFDEFHERSLHADLALALSLQIQQYVRPDLRILIMSATLDSESLSLRLDNAPVITSEGRQFPVNLKYAAVESDSHVSVKMALAIRKALREEAGDVLCFLPGSGEIRRTMDELEPENIDAILCPLYGDLSFRQQQEAIQPRGDGRRKIVLATSIAETSLTIEGIRVVIDGGLSRVPRFDPRSGLTRLETVRVTRDAADQRAGRAGRLGPGVCYRLWTEGTQRNLIPQRKPEILEADLAPLLLELAGWGVKEVNELTWITPPPTGSVSQAKELLTQLDALNEKGITARGKEMLQFPTHPRIAHMLEMSIPERQPSLAADLAALLEERDPLGREAGADISIRIEALRKWRAGERVNADRQSLERIERLAANWRRILKCNVDNTTPADGAGGILLMAAYPERIARQQQSQGEYYQLSNGRVAKLPARDHLIHESWLCVAQMDPGVKEGKIFLAAPINERDLLSLAMEVVSMSWDAGREMVVAAMEKRVSGLVLEQRQIKIQDEEAKDRVMLEVIREKGLRLLEFSEETENLRKRIQSLRLWRKDEAWPDVSDQSLLDTLESWLIPFMNGIYKLSDLRKLDFHNVLISLIPWDLQNRLDQFAPVRLPVPSGSLITLQYSFDGMSPVMEVRLQEMFGLPDTPAVNDGRMKVLLHLLSPGFKPVQVTQDLKSFWENAYHEVRKELRMRYPKHSWPEDPWTAQAIRGAKKRTS